MSDKTYVLKKRLPPDDWIRRPSLVEVLSALTKENHEVRLVGGCIRNTLLGQPVDDVDLATTARPGIVVKLLENADIRAIPSGIEHGTVTAVIGEDSYHVTSLRKDITTDGRRAVVKFTDSWMVDAARRDFTFNSLNATPEGTIYDYFDGYMDLMENKIQFVGNTQERIMEDHLRILRYFRFIATLEVEPDDETYQLCVSKAYLLAKLSGERIWGEFSKILLSDNGNEVINRMIGGGVVRHFLPEAVETEHLKQLVRLETLIGRPVEKAISPILHLATLISKGGTNANNTADRLRFSNDQRRSLKDLLIPKWQVTWDMTENQLRAGLYKMGTLNIMQLILLNWSRMLVDGTKLSKEQTDSWNRIVKTVSNWTNIVLPVKGQDLINSGFERGPEISLILRQLEQWWMDGGCRANREKCLGKLDKIVIPKNKIFHSTK